MSKVAPVMVGDCLIDWETLPTGYKVAPRKGYSP